MAERIYSQGDGSKDVPFSYNSETQSHLLLFQEAAELSMQNPDIPNEYFFNLRGHKFSLLFQHMEDGTKIFRAIPQTIPTSEPGVRWLVELTSIASAIFTSSYYQHKDLI